LLHIELTSKINYFAKRLKTLVDSHSSLSKLSKQYSTLYDAMSNLRIINPHSLDNEDIKYTLINIFLKVSNRDDKLVVSRLREFLNCHSGDCLLYDETNEVSKLAKTNHLNFIKIIADFFNQNKQWDIFY